MDKRHFHLKTTAVVFIDPRVDDVAALLAGLKPGEKAFILDPKKDGLAQMARDLRKAHLTGLASISVVAHGAEGALTLGRSTIEDGNLAAHAAALSKIGAALKTNGTLNLYACNTAAGADGRTFIADLSKYAGGADVAAATHQIGRAPGGENWTLDATTGAPVSANGAPFTNAAMQSYQGTLSGVFRVPQGAANYQEQASPILLSNGDLGVAYYGSSTYSIYVDAFDSNGNRIGNEITSPTADADQTNIYQNPVTATGASANTFWVVSFDNVLDNRSPTTGSNSSIIAQLFTVSGSTITASSTKKIVDTTASGDDHENPSLVKLANGNYVMGWEKMNVSMTTGSLQVQVFDSNFNAVSASATTVSLPSQTSASSGPIVLGANGNSVSAIYQTNPNNGGHEWGLTFDVAANGSISNQTTPVDLTTRGVPSDAFVEPSLAELPGNKILVTYTTKQNANTGQDLYGVIYNQDFSVAKNPFLISASTPTGNGTYGATGVQEVALPNGGFIVTYARSTGNNQKDIFARLYDANDNPLTNEFLVDTPAANQILAEPQIVTAGGSGGLAITFQSEPNGAPIDLDARIYSDIGPTSTGAAVTLGSQYATPTSSGTSVSTLFNAVYNSPLNHAFSGVAVTGDTANATTQGSWQYSSNGGTSWTSISTGVSNTNATIIAAGDSIRFNPVAGYKGTPGGLTVHVWDGQDGFTADSTGKDISGYIFDTSGTSQSTSSFQGAFAGTTDALSTTVIAPPTIVSGGYKISLISGSTTTAGAPGALTGDMNPGSNNTTSGLSVVDVIYGSNSAVAAGTAVTGAYGTLTLKADGSYTYVANQTTAINNAATGSHPLDTFTYDVSNGRTAAETFAVTIDRAPTGTGIKTNAPEGATTTGDAKAAFANETDKDGDALSVASVSYTDPSNGNITPGQVGQSITGRYGTLTLKADGSYSYVANNAANYTTDTLAGKPTVDKFSYTSADQYGAATTPQVMEFDVTCFASGTLIRTRRGDVAVEDLAAGDLAVTASGASRPITWIGHRTIDCRDAAHARPVRVAAHAFGPGLPARDLLLSPGHPVLVGADADDEGGHLVPIMCLINGTTISRLPVETVTYWHVELDQHDILLAEGLPAESYLDWGDRAFFTEGADHALANPDFVVPGLAGRCRPVALDGRVVEAERRRLDVVFAARLAAMSTWPNEESLFLSL